MQPRQRSARQRRVDQATVKRPERPTLLLRGGDASDVSTPYQAQFQTPLGTVELGPVAREYPPDDMLESIVANLSLDETPTGGALALIDPDTDSVVARRQVAPCHELRSIKGGKQHDGQ